MYYCHMEKRIMQTMISFSGGPTIIEDGNMSSGKMDNYEEEAKITIELTLNENYNNYNHNADENDDDLHNLHHLSEPGKDGFV